MLFRYSYACHDGQFVMTFPSVPGLCEKYPATICNFYGVN